MRMNSGLQKLWQLGKHATNDIVGQFGVTMDQVFDDLKDLGDDFKDKIDDMLNEWAADDTVFELFEGFLAVSEKGWDASVAYLRANNKKLQGYLKKQVRLTPHLVGSMDGFLQVYLATPADRWVRSPRYRKGVKIGRFIGVVCAFTIFLPVSVGRAMIGMLPGASRAASYFAKRWKAAGEARAKDQGHEQP